MYPIKPKITMKMFHYNYSSVHWKLVNTIIKIVIMNKNWRRNADPEDHVQASQETAVEKLHSNCEDILKARNFTLELETLRRLKFLMHVLQ